MIRSRCISHRCASFVITKKNVVSKSFATHQWAHLLHDSKHSDVAFLCKDNVSVPAHKCVLEAASPFFKSYFSSDWANWTYFELEDKNTISASEYEADLIKSMINLLYTGKLSEQEWRQHAPNLLELGHIYVIPDIKAVCERACEHYITSANLAQLLRLSKVLKHEQLFQCCCEYTRKEPIKCLTHSKVMAIANDDHALWDKFMNRIEGTLPPHPTHYYDDDPNIGSEVAL